MLMQNIWVSYVKRLMMQKWNTRQQNWDESMQVAVEEIRADAGLDVGGTLIGMHLKKVAVPVRLEQDRIGSAILLAARVRPKFIGGERAVYDESLKDGYPEF